MLWKRYRDKLNKKAPTDLKLAMISQEMKKERQRIAEKNNKSLMSEVKNIDTNTTPQTQKGEFNIMPKLDDAINKVSFFKRRWVQTAAVSFGLALVIAVGPIANMISNSLNRDLPLIETIPFEQIDGKDLNTNDSYDDIFGKIEKLKNSNEHYYTYDDGRLEFTAESAVNDKASLAPSAPEAGTGADGGADFSDTNIQVEGVQEADIIKTDGKYIYVLHSNELYIAKADSGKLTKISNLDFNTKNPDDENIWVNEFFLQNGKLVVIKNVTTYDKTENPNDVVTPRGAATEVDVIEPDTNSKIAVSDDMVSIMPIWGGWYRHETKTVADIYDLTNIQAPKLVNSIGQSGHYQNSRMIGSVLYLITTHDITTKIDKEKPETFVPTFYYDDTTAIAARGCIIIDPNLSTTTYTVISGIETEKGGKMVSNLSTLGYSGNIYVSTKSIYVTSYDSYVKDTFTYDATKITKYSINNGEVKLVAQNTVPGTTLNQFSMDEHNDIFRIAVTVNGWSTEGKETIVEYTDYLGKKQSYVSFEHDHDQYNALYTLDKDLKHLATIDNIAKDERIYSVRFMGDVAYFVTFRNVDPLFSVDLKDPKNPVIMGELKIPGLSDYLQSFGAGRLFGFGRDAEVETGAITSLKLSMFDVTDNFNLTEKHKLNLDGSMYSEATYNHKAILVNQSKNLIAFSANNQYFIYSYNDETGFKQLSSVNFGKDQYFYQIRGLFIGEYFYVIADNTIQSFDMEHYKNVDFVDFSK